MAQGVAVAADAQRFASQPHAAAPRAPQAAQGLGQFAAPGAHQARDAQDLAAIERERDAVHADVVGDAVDFKQGGGVTACRQFGRVVAAQFPPDHAAHQRIRRQARQRGAEYVAAVAQDGAAVAVLEDLGHAVADIDDADALRFQIVQHAEEGGGFHFGQRRRGFIQDQDFAVQGQRFGDFDQLLAGYAQVVHAQARVDLLPQPCQHLGGARIQAGEVHPGARPGGDLGHEDVLGYPAWRGPARR
ncbi:hypothetical protein G6F31_016827 [Rhizopus arrhizus]|nr:hypothetical protein G6F31_016827 [Rhizopus arrhizus]